MTTQTLPKTSLINHSTKLVSNLKTAETQIASIASELKSHSTFTKNKILQSNFDQAKIKLNAVLEFMDRIINFDPNEVATIDQATEIQSWANSIHKNLAEARKELNLLVKDPTGNTAKLSPLRIVWEKLAKLYTDKIQDSHVTWERFDEIDVSLLRSFEKSYDDLNTIHRKSILQAFAKFAMPGEPVNPFTIWCESLSQEQSENIDSAYANVCSVLESRQAGYELRLSPFLKTLTNSINELLPASKNIRLLELAQAIQDANNYSVLVANLLEHVLISPQIKLSDLAKVLLPLKALRTINYRSI